jgi:lysozyme family protein
MADFASAIDFVLQNEGGLVDNRNDHGGVTNFGVTLQMLTAYKQRQCSNDEVVNLTQGEAKQLYESMFWNKLRVSGLNQAIATAILDTAVNQGQALATRLAQECLGPHMNCDGIMGSETLEELDKCDVPEFIYSYIGLLQDRYVALCINAPNQLVFLRGWLNRSRRLFTLLRQSP